MKTTKYCCLSLGVCVCVCFIPCACAWGCFVLVVLTTVKLRSPDKVRLQQCQGIFHEDTFFFSQDLGHLLSSERWPQSESWPLLQCPFETLSTGRRWRHHQHKATSCNPHFDTYQIFKASAIIAPPPSLQVCPSNDRKNNPIFVAQLNKKRENLSVLTVRIQLWLFVAVT